MKEMLCFLYFLCGVGYFVGAWNNQEHKNFENFIATFIMSALWPTMLVAIYVDKTYLDK